MIQREGYNSESVPAKSCSRIKRWLPLESWVSTVTGWKGPTPPHPSHHSTCGLDKTNILTIHVSEDLSDTRAQCWLYLWQIMYHLAGRECDRTERYKHGDQKLDQVWAPGESGPTPPLSSVIDLVLEVFDGLVFIQSFKTELIECLIRRGGQKCNCKISF